MIKTYQTFAYQVDERVASLTLNRPEQRNAFSEIMMAEMKDALMSAEQDPMVKVLIIKAEGDFFSAGYEQAQLQRMSNWSPEQHQIESAGLGQLYLSLFRSTKVVIAQVSGEALGPGCGLAAVCDFVIASPGASFGFPEVRYGLVAAPAIRFLLRRIGEARARQLLLSGQSVTAETASHWGLVNEVVAHDSLETSVSLLAAQICNSCSPASLQLSKKLIADLSDFPVEDAVRFSARMNAYARASEDGQRGLRAWASDEEISW